MSGEPKMFRVYPDNQDPQPISEVNFAESGIREREHIQEWIARNPDILGEDLLIISKEFSDFDLTRERLDLLAVDTDGKLVIIELKRDDTGADAHWQAVKYASYLSSTSPEDIQRIFSRYAGISEAIAGERLREHLDASDLNSLNNDQRIIIASHRFAPEVTSAVLWLNQQSHVSNLISCVQLTPYQENSDGQLFLQSNTIIPLPGAERYSVQVDSSGQVGVAIRTAQESAYGGRRDDEVSQWCFTVKQLLNDKVAEPYRVEDGYRFARGDAGHRWYRMWHRRPHWGREMAQYLLDLARQNGEFLVTVEFAIPKPYLRSELGWEQSDLDELSGSFLSSPLPSDKTLRDTRGWLGLRSMVSAKALDSDLSESVATTVHHFIENAVTDFENFALERTSPSDDD